jgi:hypothetical protein
MKTQAVVQTTSFLSQGRPNMSSASSAATGGASSEALYPPCHPGDITNGQGPLLHCHPPGAQQGSRHLTPSPMSGHIMAPMTVPTKLLTVVQHQHHLRLANVGPECC